MAKAKQKGASPKTFYWILGIVAVLGIGAIVIAAMGGNNATMATELIVLSDVPDAAALLERARGIEIGEASAPLTMLVFSDFQCPACKHWALNVEAPLKADLVANGQMRLVYYDFPLSNHPHSFVVSRASRCAEDQDRFWDYHNLAFAQQEQWSYSRTTPRDALVDYARTLGLDMDTFTSCLDSDEHAETVTASQMLGAQLGVRGTPTVFVNGRQLQNWNDYQAARAEIQAMVAGVGNAAS